MRLYVSGPMTGIPEFNYPAFADACIRLRAEGHTVISPHEVNPQDGSEHEWAWYMRRDLVALMDADAIVVLPGWEDSRGALLETHVATALGMPLYALSDVVGVLDAAS